jgi:high-affinity K+ transport system ATPase subunit B
MLMANTQRSNAEAHPSWFSECYSHLQFKNLRRSPERIVLIVGFLIACLISFKELFLISSSESIAVAILFFGYLILSMHIVTYSLRESRRRLYEPGATGLQTSAYKIIGPEIYYIDANDIQLGDKIIIYANGIIPANGIVVEGVALVDEAAITGESSPVTREPFKGRDKVIAGTRVIKNDLTIVVTKLPMPDFLNQKLEALKSQNYSRTDFESKIQRTLYVSPFLIFVGLTMIRGLAIYPFYSSFFEISLSLLIAVSCAPILLIPMLDAIKILALGRALQLNYVPRNPDVISTSGKLRTLLLDHTPESDIDLLNDSQKLLLNKLGTSVVRTPIAGQPKTQLVENYKKLGAVGLITGQKDAARALINADIGIVLNSDPKFSQSLGNIVDLESKPSKISSLVLLGKALNSGKTIISVGLCLMAAANILIVSVCLALHMPPILPLICGALITWVLSLVLFLFAESLINDKRVRNLYHFYGHS